VSVKVYEYLSGGKTTAVFPGPFIDTQNVEVLKAYNVGIANGASADKFSPHTLLDREQALGQMGTVRFCHR